MTTTAEAHGTKCLLLDDLIVQQPWNEAAIRELTDRATAFRQFPGYEYAAAYFLGRTSFFRREYQNALSLFEDGYSLAADSDALTEDRKELEQDICLIGCAAALFQLGRFDDARDKLSQVRHPDHPELAGRYQGELGWNALRQKNYKEAEAAFRESLRWRPANMYALNGLGNALFDQKRFAEAKKEQIKALAMDETFNHAWCDLGHANLELDDVVEAMRNFKYANKYNLRTAHFFRGAGTALYRSGHKAEGQTLISHAQLMDDGKIENEFISAISEILDTFFE